MRQYKVVITETASADLAEAFAYIHERSPRNAERWLRDLYGEISELESFAGYGPARESEFLGVALRQKVFKSHRIVFSVDEEEALVIVHYVQHAAKRAIGEVGEEADE